MEEKVSLRASELVIAAIHNLEERKGSSTNDIVDFISRKYNLSNDQVKDHVEKALERGVHFGVLSENGGLYQVLDVGNKKITKACPQKKKKVTIKVPCHKKGRRTKRKSKRSGMKKKRCSRKNRSENSKKCCALKILKGRRQKLNKAIQQRTPRRRKNSKQ